jgi:hypothetical protein
MGRYCSLTPISSFYRYTTEHPGVTPNSIAASKDFMRNVAFGIEGKYNDPKACLSSIIQTYKNFTGGWQWAGNEKTDGLLRLRSLPPWSLLPSGLSPGFCLPGFLPGALLRHHGLLLSCSWSAPPPRSTPLWVNIVGEYRLVAPFLLFISMPTPLPLARPHVRVGVSKPTANTALWSAGE